MRARCGVRGVGEQGEVTQVRGRPGHQVEDTAGHRQTQAHGQLRQLRHLDHTQLRSAPASLASSALDV